MVSIMARKRSKTRVLEVCNYRNMSSSMLMFNTLLWQMITQYWKLRNVRLEGKESKSNSNWFSFLKPDFYNNPIDYRKLVMILQTVLRAEMKKAVVLGSHQIGILLRRVKRLLSYMPQFQEEAILNIDLWLMKKLLGTWSMAALK